MVIAVEINDKWTSKEKKPSISKMACNNNTVLSRHYLPGNHSHKIESM